LWNVLYRVWESGLDATFVAWAACYTNCWVPFWLKINFEHRKKGVNSQTVKLNESNIKC